MNFRVILISVLSFAFILAGCSDSGNDKIKLADLNHPAQSVGNQTVGLTKTAPDGQITIAILTFKNDTPDQNMNWLQRGLSDMLVSQLSKSEKLKVLPLNPGKSEENSSSESAKFAAAQSIARENKANILLSGRFFREADSLFIEVDLFDVTNNRFLDQQKVSGKSMEEIFAMVSSLTGSLFDTLHKDLKIEVSDNHRIAMTSSLEAYRCYTLGSENMEKLLLVEAAHCFDDAVRIDSTFAAAYLELAMLNYSGRQMPMAEQALRKAIQYRDKLTDAQKVMLKLFKLDISGQSIDYKKTLREAVNRFPGDTKLRLRLARLYRNAGQLDAALQEFEAVQMLDPDNKHVNNDLAYVYAMRGDFDLALKYIDKYQSLSPNDPNPYDSKGEILLMAGRFREAVPQYMTAIEKWPNFTNSAIMLTQIFTEVGKEKAALKYSDTAIKSESDVYRQRAYIQRAEMFSKFEQYDKAEQALLTAISYDPINTHALRYLKEIYTVTGQTQKFEPEFKNMFNAIKQRYRKSGLASNAQYNFLALCFLSPPNFPNELFELGRKISADHPARHVQARLDFALAYLHQLRGEWQQALHLIESQIDPLIDVVVRSNRVRWASAWRPISLLFSALPETDNSVFEKFIAKLRIKAEENKRQDIVILTDYFSAMDAAKSGNPAEMEKIYAASGTAGENKWQICGPFPANEYSGFAFAYPPENNSAATPEIEFNNVKYFWRPITDHAYDGYINLLSLQNPALHKVAYARLYIDSETEQRVQLRFGMDEAGKLWLNNTLLWQRYQREDVAFDRDIVSVLLHPGINMLQLKITNSDLDWGFHLRITDDNGKGVKGLKFLDAPPKDNSVVLN